MTAQDDKPPDAVQQGRTSAVGNKRPPPGKPFVKGDPRINRKGGSKRKAETKLKEAVAARLAQMVNEATDKTWAELGADQLVLMLAKGGKLGVSAASVIVRLTEAEQHELTTPGGILIRVVREDKRKPDAA
jgi:hypothetical protein